MARLLKNGILSIFLMVTSFCCLATQLDSTSSDNESASAVIKHLTDVLIDTMKQADALGYEGRYEKLHPEITSTHALASIAKYSVGDSWDTLTEEQKTTLVKKFAEYSVSAYAGQFDSYDGEHFEIVSEKAMRRGRAQVEALLKRPEKDDIKFDYILTQVNGKWLVLNIIVEGVSDLALKRAQYTSVIRREGFDALLAKLSAKIDMYAGKVVPGEEVEEEEGSILSRISDKIPSISMPSLGGWFGDDDASDSESSSAEDTEETSTQEEDQGT